ncbi:MAG TPA: WcbI family polysaccharide biosynthesis putative acetyltransferase [Opitutaceae bacterium]|jgi:hypothetical protein|nr:WcbI family polysaccharide biosynthesis putative acetyltransferase [Opitutaceae bacterium]
MSASKKRLLVYGNCQGGWLSGALAKQPDVAAEYEVVYLSDYGGGPPPEHPVHQPGFFGTVSGVIWQTAAACRPPAFLSALSAGCRQIRYPTLWLKFLWPTYVVDPRNQPEKEFPWGRYPYGDRLVLRLLEAGVPLADLAKRYVETDLNTVVNLDRFREMTLAELKFNDQQSDIPIVPYIESQVRERKLFGTVNHPTYLMLRLIYQGVLRALLPGKGPSSSELPASSTALLGTVETPLHPQIISHFKLAWARPGMRWLYHSRFFTLEEYIESYGGFAPLSPDGSPQLWLARTQQAVAHGNFEEAELLLLEAAAQYPKAAPFLHFLGSVKMRQGKLVEAEQVFRYALSRHAPSAGLLCDLGIVMFRQGIPAEAGRLFQEALRLDPAHADARNNLALATKASQLGFRHGDRRAS